MTFDVSDFNDLKRLLAAHPEWRAELRDLLLSEDFQALPAIVRESAEAQRRIDQRLAELAERVSELAEAQRRTDQRLAELAERVSELTEAQRRTDQRLAELTEAQRRTDQRLAELTEAQRRTDQRLAELAEGQQRLEVRVGRVEDRLGGLQGRELESRYRQRAAAFFGRWFRGIRVVDDNDLIERVENHLNPDELQELLVTDMVVRGRTLQKPERPETWLAVEVSSVVDRADVARAVRRAELLRRAGLPGLPVVAGESATAGAEAEARAVGVALLQDGSAQLWDEAFAAWPI